MECAYEFICCCKFDFHGGPHAFSCGDGGYNNIATYRSVYKTREYTKQDGYGPTTNDLKKISSIKHLRLLSCNAGHRYHTDDNLVNAFKTKINNSGRIYACDGSVGFKVKNGRYYAGLAYHQRGWYDSLPSKYKRGAIQSYFPSGFSWHY